MDQSGFWFVACISNPCRFASRYRLYREFRKHIVEELGANLLTIECAFGDRPHEVVGPEVHPNPREIHIQVRSDSEVWIKENLLNLGFRHMPPSCRYVAWVDADIRFLRKDIVEETIHQLQHYGIVQMFQHCLDLGPTGEVMETHTSFGYSLVANNSALPHRHRHRRHGYMGAAGGYAGPGGFWHPGYAFAARREILDRLGGLLDIGALGAADHHMCLAWVGRVEESIPEGIHENYRQALIAYQDRAAAVLHQNFGYVPGTIVHSFHGKKRDRRYNSRWDILIRHAFDPIRHLRRNLHGVIELDPCHIGLRDGIRAYFRARNEDSIDAE